MNKTEFVIDRVRAGLSDDQIFEEARGVWPEGVSLLSIRRHRAKVRARGETAPTNSGALPRRVLQGTAGGPVRELVERLLRSGLTNPMVVGAVAREIGRAARLDENKVASVRVALRKVDKSVPSDQDARQALGLPRRGSRNRVA